MAPFVILILLLWLGITGFVRSVAPSWQLNVDKKHAKPTEQVAPDSQRLKRIRISGAIRLAVCVALIWLVGITVGLSPAPAPPPAANELEHLLFQRGAEFVRANKGMGLTIAAISGDREAVVEIGMSRLGSRQAVNKDTLFEIGSITKVFTGIALAQHIEAGELKLDQSIADLLPKGFEPSPEARAVTLKQLATHTSGFPRLPGSPRPFDILNYILFGGDPYVGVTLERFGEALRTVKLNARPGEKMEYSNFGVSLLGWLLAQRTGTDYEQYIRSRILTPLGMSQTALKVDSAQQKNFAQGYRSVQRLGPLTIAWRSSPWNLADHLAGAGGLRSTGSDMLKFLRANMRPPNTSMAAALRRSHQELFRENEGRSVGLNWIRSQKKDSPLVIWHNGGTGGFMSYLGFLEDGSTGVVVLSNTGKSVDALGAELLRELAARPPRQ